MDEASPTKLPEAMPYGGFFCQGGEGNSIGCAPFVIIPLPQGEVEDLLNQNERDMPHFWWFLWERAGPYVGSLLLTIIPLLQTGSGEY